MALVGVPRAAGREVREAHEAPPGRASTTSASAVRHRARAPRRGRQRHAAAAGRALALPDAVRARLPRIVIASGGSSGSGRPAAEVVAPAPR